MTLGSFFLYNLIMKNTYEAKWEALFLKRNKNGKEQIAQSLSQLNFDKSFKVVNVVGTNGKGSVSGYLADSLARNGYKVGIFTSPHIIAPNERISINGKDISNKEFFDIYKEINNDLIFFSSMYVVAMKHFQNEDVDIAIIEAGIGGKHDSTNTIDGDYGILTSVAIDHEALLGDNVVDIAKDKLGIINEGMKFYIPSYLDESLKLIISDYNVTTINNESNDFVVRNQKLAAGFLKETFDINEESFILPKGRCQVVGNNIIDVAHNQEGIIQAVKHLELTGIEYDQVVISVRKRKNIKDVKHIFSNKDVFAYQLDDTYKNNEELGIDDSITNLKEIISSDKRTLFIGGFELASLVLKG